MKHLGLLLTILTLCSCNKASKQRTLTDFIPKNAYLTVTASSPEGLNSNLKNNAFLKTLSDAKGYKNLSEQLTPISHLNTDNKIIINFNKGSNNLTHYTFTTPFKDSLLLPGKVKDFASETITRKANTVVKYQIDGQNLYTTIKDSILVASSSIALLDSLLLQQKEKTPNPLLETANPDASLSVLLNHKNKPFDKPLVWLDSVSMRQFSKHTLVDVDMSQDEILLNGITKANDSTESLINVFKNTLPQDNQMTNVTPANADGFLSFTFDNVAVLKENLDAFNGTSSELDTFLFDNITEAGVVFQGEKQAIILNSLDETLTADALLNEQNLVETYRGIEIYGFSEAALFKQAFYPFITYNKATKYCILDSFFVFSDSMDVLQNIISNYQNNTVLSARSYYENITKNLSNASSLLMVSNHEKLEQDVSLFFEENININLNDYKASALQFVYDNRFAHVHGIVQKHKGRAEANTVSEAFNIQLDETLLTAPQFVTNHLNNQKDIVVQDVKNNLYLLSNSGSVLWKKQLQGPILGKIEQIDMYRNGRLQLAFATPNRVYVVDRNGKDVSPFPMKFNDKITQPLSVFDYDNNRKYRLMVTQGKNVLMYNAKGKSVKGFNFTSAESELIHQPQHIRAGNKDYLLLKTKDKLYILHRTGKTRVTPKSQFNYSGEAVYFYQGNFATTTDTGVLVTIDQKGGVASRNLNLAQDHDLVSTSKTLVAQSDNKLQIKSKSVEMDFGNYTAPNIFYIYDKIYVTTTDKQANKVYLFDSQAKPIANFPVYGNSKIDMANIDKDRNLEVVTTAGDKSIVVYQIN